MTLQPTESQLDAQAEHERRRLRESEAGRRLWEIIGLPLICRETECRRARRCLGGQESRGYGVQPCFSLYREEMRFLLYSPGGIPALRKDLQQDETTPAPC